MSPAIQRSLTTIRLDMQAYPNAFTSKTALEFFLNATKFNRQALMEDRI